MKQCDFIYGSEVIAQCQAQINFSDWDNNDPVKKYLLILKKPSNYFNCWAKLRNDVRCIILKSPKEVLPKEVLMKVGTDIDDMIKERKRVFLWAEIKGKVNHVSPRSRGHGKQQIKLKCNTYCARDFGISWVPD